MTETRPRLADADGFELEALLYPITPVKFVTEYWGKKPLHVKGSRDKFKGLFDGATFTQAVASLGTTPTEHLRVSFDKKTPAQQRRPSSEPEDVSHLFPIPPETAGALFDAGATLCFTDIHLRVPRLAQFVAAIKRQLGYPGRVAFAGYLSPAGAGFNWHFDGRIASTLQIEGSKRWRFSSTVAIDWPRGNGLMMSDGSARYADSKTVARAPWERLGPLDKKKTNEVLLEPGDLLVLPAGTWHDAAGGTTGSLALNLSFTPVSYTSIVGDLLDALLASDPAWRSPTPLLPVPGGRLGEVDARGLETLGRQLANAARALTLTGPDSPEVVKLLASFVQSAGPPVAAPAPVGPIAEGDMFRIRADGNLYVREADRGTKLSVSVGTRIHSEATGPAMRFVRCALRAKEFSARDCREWGEEGMHLAWQEVQQVLAHLVAEGLIERVSSRRPG